DLDADATILLVRQDRGALQGGTDDLAVHAHFLLRADRDHGLVVGEPPVDQLGSEADIVALDPAMAAAHFHFPGAVAAFQQALQLGHALARDDDLALGPDRLLQGSLA